MSDVIEQYLKDAGTPEDPCWIPCLKGDPGAVLFASDVSLKGMHKLMDILNALDVAERALRECAKSRTLAGREANYALSVILALTPPRDAADREEM
jgi:hypothetical protein